MERYQHVYLSPHYDDIALSCGGAIHRQTEAGQAVIGVTICAASPDHARLSPFARAMHQSWGDLGDAVATRLAEDQASMTVLGVNGYRLSFRDCIYRGGPEAGVWYYNSDPDLFGEVHPDDWPLATKVAVSVTDLFPDINGVIIYAPLTVGHHVDHQLTHRAAWQLYEQGYQIIFYEDYPYVDPHYPFTSHGEHNHYNLEVALAETRPAQLISRLNPITDENLRAKIESIRAYRSQLDILFGGETAMEKYIRSYALHVGQGTLAERVWEPPLPG